MRRSRGAEKILGPKKYYAVRNGRKIGIYDTWIECKEQIEGYSGAIYKSFSSYEDAYNYLNQESNRISQIKNNTNTKEIMAYVDGSFSQEMARYSYGCVILYRDEVIKLSGTGNNENWVSMRNVAGELLGAMHAVKWAYDNKCDSITIYHDYEGIERWANRTWKTNKVGTKYYSEFIMKYRNYLEIKFVKVQAHSGDRYNEEADKLAKEALNGV